MKYPLIILLALFTTACSLQQPPHHQPKSISSHVILHDTLYRFEYRIPKNKIRTKNHRVYNGYYNQRITKSNSDILGFPLHGKFLAIHRGRLYIKGQYRKGERCGRWFFFDNSGQVVKTIDYRNKYLLFHRKDPKILVLQQDTIS